MHLLAFLSLASSALLASSAPSTTLVPDKPASGSALTNAYWLLDVNAMRAGVDQPRISVFNATLAAEAAEWVGTCTYGRAEVPNLQMQAVGYYEAGSDAPIKEVVQGVVDVWVAQDRYSIAAFPSFTALGCKAVYCETITTGGGWVLPFLTANQTSGWIGACNFKY
ncbi:hypothetical protein JCM10207_006729 [Rhodosporidiobolus poonsookiae]